MENGLHDQRRCPNYQLGHTNECIQSMTLAANLCKNDPRPVELLGYLNVQLKQYESALSFYRRVAVLQPENPQFRQAILNIEMLIRQERRNGESPTTPSNKQTDTVKSNAP